MTTKIQVRRDTTGNWTTHTNKVPASGEFCYDTDLKTLKIGDGTTTYGNLNVIADSNDTYQDNDARYVQVAGANMTGDLTLGTDKITLDAGNGSSEFNGNLSIKNSSSIQVKATGDDATSNISLTSDGRGWFAGGTFLGGTSVSAPNASLNSNGSATFAGETNIGDIYTGGGTRFLPTGEVYIRQDNGAAGVFNVNSGSTAGSDTTITFLANGSASFAGDVSTGTFNTGANVNGARIGENGGLISQRSTSYNGDATQWAGYYGTNQTSTITADGSASFANTVLSGDSTYVGAYTYVSTGGVGVMQNASTPKVLLLADGSASFTGNVTVGPYNTSPYVAGAKLFTNNSGGASLILNGDGSTGTALGVYDGNSNSYSATISRNGSATFGGGSTVAGGTDIKVGNGQAAVVTNDGSGKATLAGSAFVLTNTSGNNTVDFATATGSALFQGGIQSNTSVNIYHPQTASNGIQIFGGYANGVNKASIRSDGTAVFSGNITAGNVSDIKFKENITDAKPQLTDVVALGSSLKNWDWKEEAPLNDELKSKRFLGLIAQEADDICPTLSYTVTKTKQGKELTPEQVIPPVYEDRVVPAEYRTVVIPEELNHEGEIITPRSTEQVLVTPEYTEKVLVKEEEIIPPTYEELDDSYKAINHDILVMKLLGAVAELTARVEELENNGGD